MTVDVTFNGQREIQLPDGTMLSGSTDDHASRLLLWRKGGDGVLWGPVDLDVRPDPTLRHAGSTHVDYAASLWSEFLIVAGDGVAAIVELGSGRVAKALPLEFVGKASLDVLHLEPIPGNRFLIASSRRLWILDEDLAIHRRVDTQSILNGSPKVDGSRVTFRRFDFEDFESDVEEAIEIDDG